MACHFNHAVPKTTIKGKGARNDPRPFVKMMFSRSSLQFVKKRNSQKSLLKAFSDGAFLKYIVWTEDVSTFIDSIHINCT
jgi:hypothetical protein